VSNSAKFNYEVAHGERKFKLLTHMQKTHRKYFKKPLGLHANSANYLSVSPFSTARAIYFLSHTSYSSLALQFVYQHTAAASH
jgi:hypothetical protein